MTENDPQSLARRLELLQERWSDGDDPDELRRRREREEQWNRRIPARFRDARLDLVDDPPRTELLEWASGTPTTNVILLGPVGVGKTFAAVGALRVVHEHDWTVMFAPIVEVLDWLRPGGPDDIAQRLAGCRVLLLDDLGAERPTDWTSERLYGIVNRRWLDQRATIVTTNVPRLDLERRLDPRLFSRLVHEAVPLRLSGPDRRRT